jgi:hypothetical protein
VGRQFPELVSDIVLLRMNLLRMRTNKKMNWEVKTIKFKCDMCDKIEFVRDVSNFRRPDGWGYSKTYDCGLTHYTRDNDLCPECLRKEKLNEL